MKYIPNTELEQKLKKFRVALESSSSSSQKLKIAVEYSTNKYFKAYELLEKYDKQLVKSPEVLADPGRLRVFLQHIQRNNG